MASRTRDAYVTHLDAHLIPFFGSMEIARITSDDIEDYKKSRKAAFVKRERPATYRHGKRKPKGGPPKPISPATINRELPTLRRLFSVLIELRKLTVHPMAAVKTLKEGGGRERFLGLEEISALLKSFANERGRMITEVALNTGLRKTGALPWGGRKWTCKTILSCHIRKKSSATRKFAFQSARSLAEP